LFRDVFYDRRKNKIHLWYVEQEGDTLERKYQVLDHEHDYYLVCSPDQANCDLKTIEGHSLYRSVMKRGEKSYELRNKYHAEGYSVKELGIAPERKFLQKRFKDLDPKKVKFAETFRTCYLDIETETDDIEFPEPETAKKPILLITIKASHMKPTFMLTTRPVDTSISEFDGIRDRLVVKECSGEYELLQRFFEFIERFQIDILTGWFIEEFDLPYIFNRWRILNQTKNAVGELIDNDDVYEEWGRTKKYYAPITKMGVAEYRGAKKKSKWRIPGLSVIDYLPLYKRFTYEMQSSYKLEDIAQKHLGHGKMKYHGSMAEFQRNSWDRFCAYNVIDTDLVEELEQKLGFLKLAVNFCAMALTPLEDIQMVMLLITGIIHRELNQRGLALPDIERDDVEDDELVGGYVFANPGLHSWLLSYDFESLYPFMVMLFNVSPETKVKGITKEEAIERDLILTPVDGVYYKREQGVVASIVERIFKERKMWKEEFKRLAKTLGEDHEDAVYANNQQLIRKILINSFYGVMGNENFCFYDNDNASVITAGGRSVIMYCGDRVNQKMREITPFELEQVVPKYKYDQFLGCMNDTVVVTDTDSTYITIAELWESIQGIEKNNDTFLEFAREFDTKFFAPYFNGVINDWADQWHTKNILNFKREKIITRQLVTAKKKYITIVLENEGKKYDKPKMSVSGLEIRRSDASDFVRANMEQLVWDILEIKNEHKINEKLWHLKKKYLATPVDQIGLNTNVKTLDKYSDSFVAEEDEGYDGASDITLKFGKGTTIQCKSALSFNYLSSRCQLGIPPITAKSLEKMTYVYLKNPNIYGIATVGFIGEWPDFLADKLTVDYEYQFEKSFLPVVKRIYTALGWGAPKPSRLSGKFVVF